MLEIRCPGCGAQIEGLLRDYVRWRSDRRKCPGCGAELEISNGFVCFGICSLVSACAFAFFLLVSAAYSGVGGIGAGSLVAIVFCWGLMPIIVRSLGRWRISPGGGGASVKARRRSGVAHLSRWVFIVAVVVTGIIIGLRYRGLLLDVGGPESDLYSTEDFLAAVGLTAVVGFGIAGVALVVYIFVLIKEKRARLAEKQEELTLGGE